MVWGNAKITSVKCEKIKDTNPNLYLKKAEIALENKNYNEALHLIDEAIEFSTNKDKIKEQKLDILDRLFKKACYMIEHNRNIEAMKYLKICMSNKEDLLNSSEHKNNIKKFMEQHLSRSNNEKQKIIECIYEYSGVSDYRKKMNDLYEIEKELGLYDIYAINESCQNARNINEIIKNKLVIDCAGNILKNFLTYKNGVLSKCWIDNYFNTINNLLYITEKASGLRIERIIKKNIFKLAKNNINKMNLNSRIQCLYYINQKKYIKFSWNMERDIGSLCLKGGDYKRGLKLMILGQKNKVYVIIGIVIILSIYPTLQEKLTEKRVEDNIQAEKNLKIHYDGELINIGDRVNLKIESNSLEEIEVISSDEEIVKVNSYGRSKELEAVGTGCAIVDVRIGKVNKELLFEIKDSVENMQLESYYYVREEIVLNVKKFDYKIKFYKVDRLGNRRIKRNPNIENTENGIIVNENGILELTVSDMEKMISKNYTISIKDVNGSFIDDVSSSSRDYILDSDTRYLTIQDLNNLNKNKINFAKNEIFARKGYIFKKEVFKNYFESKDWYRGTKEVISEDDFNEYEKANLELIKEYEKMIN